jgi:hypothetical protein
VALQGEENEEVEGNRKQSSDAGKIRRQKEVESRKQTDEGQWRMKGNVKICTKINYSRDWRMRQSKEIVAFHRAVSGQDLGGGDRKQLGEAGKDRMKETIKYRKDGGDLIVQKFHHYRQPFSNSFWKNLTKIN